MSIHWLLCKSGCDTHNEYVQHCIWADPFYHIQGTIAAAGHAHRWVQTTGMRHVLDDADELREAGPHSRLAPTAPDEGSDRRLHCGRDVQLQVTPPNRANHLEC